MLIISEYTNYIFRRLNYLASPSIKIEPEKSPTLKHGKAGKLKSLSYASHVVKTKTLTIFRGNPAKLKLNRLTRIQKLPTLQKQY